MLAVLGRVLHLSEMFPQNTVWQAFQQLSMPAVAEQFCWDRF
jgi:hypothetical protein